jgi:hypothetical protein
MAATQSHPKGNSEPFGPWNPGITSRLTPELWRTCTIFRPENVYTTYDQAVEFQDLTGLALPQLIVWRPERMVSHEVLVRVIADYEIPDPEGADVPSLGINFRKMTRAILERHVAPQMDGLISDYAPARQAIGQIVETELALAYGRARQPVRDAPEPQRQPLWLWRRRPARLLEEDPVACEDRLIELWRNKAHDDAKAAAAYGALVAVMSAIRSRNGCVWGTPALLEPLVSGLACNVFGAQLIADRVAPLVAKAAAAEGFRPLPAQDHPVGISTKGAAAAGKSTMRPLLRSLAERMGARWSDFALVSPDILRQDLLEIDTLGAHYKYFGTFTSHELEVVDRKLDQHLARKAALRLMPHVLVDRFRFDSFAPESDERTQVFSRLGRRRLSYYVYLVTPPERTIERAWLRGLQIGRYKPVDDLLAHNVEAYTGMQSFFFGRTRHPSSRNQHHEFVDNDVPMREVPLTIAFGSQDEFNILDVKRMVDIDRYCKINVNARRPEEVHPHGLAWAVENNVTFLRRCVREFPAANFAHRDTGRIYARFEHGRLAWKDQAAIVGAQDTDTLVVLRAVDPHLVLITDARPHSARYLDRARALTLGRWGAAG